VSIVNLYEDAVHAGGDGRARQWRSPRL
jgi:hypothetical protein